MSKYPEDRKGPVLNPRLAHKYGLKVETESKTTQYLSPNQAARILNISGECIKQWIYRRRLPAIKLSNGYWKIKATDLEKYIQDNASPLKRKILLFDEPANLSEEAGRQLASADLEVISVQNPMDAMIKATDLVPSLFLVNTNMEGAWDFIRRVRGHGHVSRLPIMLISTSVLSNENLDLALEFEVQGVLLLPLTPEVLVQEITKVLGRLR